MAHAVLRSKMQGSVSIMKQILNIGIYRRMPFIMNGQLWNIAKRFVDDVSILKVNYNQDYFHGFIQRTERIQ